MPKCDNCGKLFYLSDVKHGAALAIPDQPETDNLCIKCNKEQIDVAVLLPAGT